MTTILLLNANFQPLGAISLKRAISLLVKDRVDIVEALPDKQLRSVHTTQPFPSVIRLRYYVNVPRRKMVWSRRAVFARDNWTCVYCGSKVTREDATIDHVVPMDTCRRLKINGSTWGNTVCACPRCNRRKSNRSLEDSGMKFIDQNFEPKVPRTNYVVIGGDLPASWKKYLEV